LYTSPSFVAAIFFGSVAAYGQRQSTVIHSIN
jgi:hypothetical protein